MAVPLAVLLKREHGNERIEKPDVLYGQATHSKKGEDFTLFKTECQRVPADGSTTFSVFALFDGHNGTEAAIYAKENLLNNVLGAMPSDLSRDDWLAALPRALVAAFVKTDKDFQNQAHSSGTTVTMVIIDGWVVTVASVGDSRCILESAEGSIYHLSADHRLDADEKEVERITASGGEVGRLNVIGGAEIGPLRCWPGGLCLSRSIGDLDVGQFIVPVPYVKQVKLSNAGGRLVIASDGVWDALSFESSLKCCHGLPAELAANQIVKEAVHVRGLKDDTTCIVVDILPKEKSVPAPASHPKKQGMGALKNMFRRKPSVKSINVKQETSEPDVVEEIFEDGSAVLAHRLDTGNPIQNMFKIYACAVCQVEIKPEEAISLHSCPSQPRKFVSPWDGPFLCLSCQQKKEAMEGKSCSQDFSSSSKSASSDSWE
ncbi:Phosphatase 2C family protein [Rhynchospora pubera]|uniref:protein-serine/threonine phosphatase n=1 Tax=Rhynchospora pubera TaxID=906938 RepID=A0AAV8BSI3_9POAL|nr:Phosphatase 2C family protein [Rhynchospora pubera]